METISVSKLKAHLSAELKKVRAGATITVTDHNHPVAKIVPVEPELEPLEMIEATGKFVYEPLEPLIEGDILKSLEEERSDRW